MVFIIIIITITITIIIIIIIIFNNHNNNNDNNRLAFVLVPGRYIILAIGIYQFIDKFIPRPEASSIMTIYNNLLTTIPNDDDLEQVLA